MLLFCLWGHGGQYGEFSTVDDIWEIVRSIPITFTMFYGLKYI